VTVTQAIIEERLGDRARSDRLLREILNSDMLGAAHYQVTEAYAQLNQSAEAFSGARQVVRGSCPGLAQMQTDFMLDPIRNDPRFLAIVKRTNSPAQPLALTRRLCHWAAMQGSRTRAGGCFLTLFLLLGFLYGLSIRNPLKGVLIGLGIGIVLAIVTWLIDKYRRR